MSSGVWKRALLGATVSTAALAFVMPGFSVLKHLVDLRDQMHLYTLRVDGSASFLGSGARDAAGALGLAGDRSEVQTDATVMLKLPGRCRIELNPLEGQKIAVGETNGHRRAEGRELPVLSVLTDQICALLAVRSSSDAAGEASLVRYLRALHIEPTAPTSMARASEQTAELKVAYVLGSPVQGKPQLWVYKDNFGPARIELSDESGQFWDIRFFEYDSPATADWFPRVIEVSRGGERVLRFTALKADAKATMPDKLF